MSSVIGVVAIARNGDRYGYYQDPNTFASRDSPPTALGEAQSHQLGSLLRETYLKNGSDTRIRDMHNELADTTEIKVRVKAGSEGAAVFDSAIATLQGLFPPTPLNEITLANGNKVMAPLGGYQYIPVETVEPINDRSLEGWTNCPNFQKHAQKVYNSDWFEEVEVKEQTFFQHVRDFIFGREASLRNAWNIFDFIDEQLTHNQTYAFRLPPTLRDHARHLANFHANAVFSDSAQNGIGNVAGRTLMHTILNSLQRISFDHDPHKFLLVESTYQPFISLFHQTEIVKKHPKLAAIPDFGSALVIELRRGLPPDTRDFLRFRFKNGTSSNFETLHVYGHREDEIPLTEFIFRSEGSAIRSNKEWRQVCGVKSKTFTESVQDNVSSCAGVFAVFFLIAMFFGGVFAWKKRQQRAQRIKLEGQEQEQSIFEHYSDAKPIVSSA